MSGDRRTERAIEEGHSAFRRLLGLGGAYVYPDSDVDPDSHTYRHPFPYAHCDECADEYSDTD